MTYKEKLKDPRWIKRREDFKSSYINNPDPPFDICELRCDGCGNTEDLNVHHKRYIQGKEPWEYEDEDLQILCKACHSTYHKNKMDLTDFFYSHRLAYSYEFKTIINICKLLCTMDTNDIIAFKRHIESVKNNNINI